MPDQVAPLESLIRQLRSYRPPSISNLIGMLEDNQDYADFVHLVKEFLAERENEIMSQAGPEQQIASFAGYFGDRYFPLPHYLRFGDAEEYSDLTQSIPLIAMGFGYQDYDDLVQNGNTGSMLMTYFFRQPYGDQGARVALGEACQEHVPAELLRRIPESGFTPEELHQLLDGTSYQALATWGDLIHLNTGNDLLDTDEEMMSNSVLPEWSQENVEYFTHQWAEAQRIQQGPFAMAEEFEKKPVLYFQEVMDFIDQQKERQNVTNIEQRVDSLPVGAAGNTPGAPG